MIKWLRVGASSVPLYFPPPPSPQPAMESVNAKWVSAPSDKVFSTSRIVTLLGSVLVALSSGTNYVGGLDTTLIEHNTN